MILSVTRQSRDLTFSLHGLTNGRYHRVKLGIQGPGHALIRELRHDEN
jgi:hypothetical protein